MQATLELSSICPTYTQEDVLGKNTSIFTMTMLNKKSNLVSKFIRKRC